MLKLVLSSQGIEGFPRRQEDKRPWERAWKRGYRVVYCNDRLTTKDNFLFVFFCRFNLLFYINPQLYGFSAVTKVLLRNIHLKCEFESALNCISTDGNAVLAKFEFDSVNPFEYMMVSEPFFILRQETIAVMFNFAKSCLVTSSLACCYIKWKFLARDNFFPVNS